MKKLVLIVSAMGLLSACAGSGDGSSGGNGITEQKLTSATWCTNSIEKMDTVFASGVSYQFFHRIVFSQDGLITWQKFSRDYNAEMKSLRKATCRQSGANLRCDGEGLENLNYQVSADGSELNLANTGKDGRARRVIEQGGTLRKCTDADNKRFADVNWN